LEAASQENTLSPKEKTVYMYVSNHSNCQSKDITDSLKISKATVKRILSDLMAKNLIVQYGKGAGISYSSS
jgi:DNA-binding MarR family transcriptional regulator